MLWYKLWLETRWRFLIGLVVVLFTTGATVLAYPEVVKLLPLASTIDAGGAIGRQIAEAAELMRDYRGYVWSQLLRDELRQLWTVCAVLLGVGGLLSQAPRGGALFTLSLPVSRRRLLMVRAAVGLAELAVLAFVPALVLIVLSPAVGESYAAGDALVHAAALFVAGSLFFSFAFLLSTAFSDIWSPLVIAFCAWALMALLQQASGDVARYGLFRVMNAEGYFRGEGLPWLGMVLSAAASAAMLYGATVNIARRDF
jgi:hypothetical protein